MTRSSFRPQSDITPNTDYNHHCVRNAKTAVCIQ